MIRKILLSIVLAASLIGCDGNTKEAVTYPAPTTAPVIVEVPVIIEEPVIDETPTTIIEPYIYTAVFTGRIVYENGLPVTDNLIIAVGDDWESFSYTDSNGTFSIDVRGDTRFMFSALSPFTVEPTYCKYITPLMVEEYTTSGGFDCNITTPIDICVENSINYP